VLFQRSAPVVDVLKNYLRCLIQIADDYPLYMILCIFVTNLWMMIIKYRITEFWEKNSKQFLFADS